MLRYLSKHPVLKSFLKKAYLSFGYYLFGKLGARVRIDDRYELESFEKSDSETFFGYHDLTPDSPCGLVIVNVIRQDIYSIALIDVVTKVCVFEHKLGVINRQIGVRGQWLNTDMIFFCDYDSESNQVVTRFLNVLSFQFEKTMPGFCFAALNENRLIFLNSFEIQRHDPDYGFGLSPPGDVTDVLLELRSSNGSLMNNVRAKDLGCVKGESCINHVRPSPNSETFVFIQRSLASGVRRDRLWLVHVKGWLLRPLTDWTIVSHFCFLDDRKLLIYLQSKRGGLRFEVFDIWNLQREAAHFMPRKGDGHPSHQDGMIVSDTYPGFTGYQKLMLGKITDDYLGCVLEVKHPPKYKGQDRCDLHPRFSYDGSSIYFDSVHTGRRCLHRVRFPSER